MQIVLYSILCSWAQWGPSAWDKTVFTLYPILRGLTVHHHTKRIRKLKWITQWVLNSDSVEIADVLFWVEWFCHDSDLAWKARLCQILASPYLQAKIAAHSLGIKPRTCQDCGLQILWFRVWFQVDVCIKNLYRTSIQSNCTWHFAYTRLLCISCCTDICASLSFLGTTAIIRWLNLVCT